MTTAARPDPKHILYGEMTTSPGNRSGECRHRVIRLERDGAEPEIIVKSECGAFSLQAYMTPNQARSYAMWLITAAGAADAFAAQSVAEAA